MPRRLEQPVVAVYRTVVPLSRPLCPLKLLESIPFSYIQLQKRSEGPRTLDRGPEPLTTPPPVVFV